MALINLNGRLVPAEEARVSLFDHGLLYGDGLFETLRVEGGRFFRPEAHLERLQDGARRLGIPLPWTATRLEAALRDTAGANGIEDGVLRLTVTRGAGPPLPDPTLCPEPAYFITVRPWTAPGPEVFQRGISLGVGGTHPQTWVPGIKSLSYLPFQQARQLARQRGFDEGLLVAGNRAVEAGTSNLFLVRNGELLTPGLESGCLPGIARAVVLELARQEGIPVRETEIPLDRLETADELFLTNSVSRVLPVTRFEQSWTTNMAGTVTTLLKTAYDALTNPKTLP